MILLLLFLLIPFAVIGWMCWESWLDHERSRERDRLYYKYMYDEEDNP